jgi:hypothetical protein
LLGLVSLDDFRQKVRDGWVRHICPERRKELHLPSREIHCDRLLKIDNSDVIKKYPEEDSCGFRQAIRQTSSDLLAYRRKYTFGSRMEKRKNIQQVINTAD